MINTWLKRSLSLAIAMLVLAGCAMTSTYSQSYLAAARRPVAVQADGKALIVTSPEFDAYVYTGRPTSFTGSATTLTLPLAAIVKESATAAFADALKGGTDASNAIKDADRYTVIVAPKLASFGYEYNQLKNVGIAITPTEKFACRDSAANTSSVRLASGQSSRPGNACRLRPRL